MHTPLTSTIRHETPNAVMHRYPGSTVAVWRTTLAPGASGPLHIVDREQVVVVLAGTASVTLDGETALVTPGDSVLLPAGATRQVRNDGPADVTTITCGVPGGRARVGDAEPVLIPWSA